MVDSLKVFGILKAGHLSDDQARAMTTAIQAAEAATALDFKSHLELRLAETKTELVRWMFVFWATQFAATVGLVIAFMRLAK